MDIIIPVLALLLLIWMSWRLVQAKRYNRFIDWLMADVKEQLLTALKQELIDNRSQDYPNTDSHIQACCYYYSQYPVRILEAAIERQIIPQAWLEDKQNKRNIQHLLFVQGAYRIAKKVEQPAP